MDIVINFFDPIAYLESKGIKPSTEGPNSSPGWVNINCPWCGDSLQHLGINLETNACNCWRCGGKSIVKLVQLLEDCNWSQALEVMEKFQNYSKPILLEREDYIPSREIKIPKEFDRISRTIGLPINLTGFLLNRGITHSMFPGKELYYSTNPIGKYRFRILFPVYLHKKLITFMTRDYTEKSKKPYIACDPKNEVIPIKHTLYGYDDVTPGGNVVLVEGPIDQWKIGSGSLATWGTGFTMEQVSLLRSLHPQKVYILYDSEEVAQEKAKKLSQAIWYCESEVVYLEDKKDPGELTIEEGRKIMEELIK